MIVYTFTFEELPGGTLRIKIEAPPQLSTTAKERFVAEKFSDHNKELMAEIARQSGGAFIVDN